MRLTRSLLTCTAAVTFILIAGGAIILAPTRPVGAQTTLPTDEVVVRLKSGVSIDTITARYTATVIDQLLENRVFILKLGNSQSAEALLPTLNADTDLYYAELNYYADMSAISGNPIYFSGNPRYFSGDPRYFSGDPRYFSGDLTANPPPSAEEQALYWSWFKLKLTEAYLIADGRNSTSGYQTVVAVLDTGLSAEHAAFLNGSLVEGYDFVCMCKRIYDQGNSLDDDGDGEIDEQTGHGTHVAGIILTIAPQAQIMPIRVLNSDGVGTYWEVAAGIRYAVDHGADIINMSLSAPEQPPVIVEAIDYALAQNVLIVSAAGNSPGVHYPAHHSGVLGVGATDQQDQIASFSGGLAEDVDVYAPGVDIFSAYPVKHAADGNYDMYLTASGTSMASPMVAGEAALLMSRYPSWSTQQVIERITHKTIAVAGTTTAGRINPVTALTTGLEVLYHPNDSYSPNDVSIQPEFVVVNHSAEAIPWTEMKLRYWYNLDGSTQTQTFSCDYMTGYICSTVTGAFGTISPTTANSLTDTYVEVGFTAAAGALAAGSRANMIVRLNKQDWSNYAEANDYSYVSLTTAVSWARVTLYRNGILVWGSEPSQGGSITPTVPTTTPTRSATATAATNTPTRSATATAATNTPTRSATATVATNTPTRSATATAATNTPTRSATATVATNTPTRSATATVATNTPTRSATATVATNTPTRSATATVATNTPTRSATATVATNTPTRSATATVVTNTPTQTGTTLPITTSLKLQYRTLETTSPSYHLRPHFNIVNTGSASVPLTELKIRYWFTEDAEKVQNCWCDYAALNCANLTSTFVKLGTARANADSYLEIGFTDAAGQLAAGYQTQQIELQIARSDWTNYTQTNDYSFDPTKLAFADDLTVTLYRQGVLIWGTEP